MTTPNTSTFNVDTHNESSANTIPVSSFSAIPTLLADTASLVTSNTVTVGTSNNIGWDHQYINYYYSIDSLSSSAGPNSYSGISSSVSFNDAPLGLLSVHFTGREGELVQMMKAFEVVRGDVPTRFGLYAEPGVGKSQLTLALAKESFAQGLYNCVFWMSSVTKEKLHQGFSKLLHLVGHPKRSDPAEIVRLTAARQWLESFTSGRWLLVLDNVSRETVDFLREHLPRSNNHGNILFTTRTEHVAMALAHTSGEQHEILELQVPNEEDAVRLLLGHFRDGEIDKDEWKVKEVVRCVAYLPLAIAQAAAYMRQTGSTLGALLTILDSEHKIDMLEWENDLSVYQEKSVAATFTPQLDDLQQHFPDVSNLLKLLAYFAPVSIPLDMLITGASILSKSQPQKESDSVAPETTSFAGKVEKKILRSCKGKEKEMSSLLALIQSPTGLHNAIAQLQNRSLIRQLGTGQSSSLRINHLTQLIILDNTKKGGAEREWFEYAVELACSAFNQVQNLQSPQSWSQCEVLIPHIQSLMIRQGICRRTNSSLLSANYRVAGYLRSRGWYFDAEVLYKQVLSGVEKQFGPEHVNTLTTKHYLALVYSSQGRYSAAEELFKQVLSNREKQLGPEHLYTLNTKHRLALVYDSQGRYSDAEMLLKHVFSRVEKQLGSEHVNTLDTKHGLASIYASQGRNSDAEVLYTEVLSSRERQLGAEHVDTLKTMNNLALVYNSQGRYREAEVMFKHVLSSEEKQLGREHVDTLNTMNNLALVYSSQGRNSDAELHVLSSEEKQLGPEHIAMLNTMNNLALVYSSQGRYNDAEVLFKHVLSSEEKQLGPEHVATLNTKYELALVYNSQGRYSDAEVLIKHVLFSREKQLGPKHVDTLKTKRGLALVYNSQGRFAEAEALLLHVLAGFEKWLGLSHPDTQTTQRRLATVYRDQGRLDDAEKMIQSILPSLS